MVKVLFEVSRAVGSLGQGGAGGEMASSETEASPPSRRRPPQSLFRSV
jgi:hypothetical protein